MNMQALIYVNIESASYDFITLCLKNSLLE